MKKVIITAIRVYKAAMSPFLGRTCRFEPSCSVYMEEAVKEHGVMKGLWMGMFRILRCSPFSKGGYDPVIKKQR